MSRSYPLPRSPSILSSTISALLRERSMSVYRLQKRTRITFSTLHRLLHQHDYDPRLSMLLRLATGLDLTLSDLFLRMETEEKARTPTPTHTQPTAERTMNHVCATRHQSPPVSPLTATPLPPTSPAP